MYKRGKEGGNNVRVCMYNVHVYNTSLHAVRIYTRVHNLINYMYIPKLGRIHVHGKSHAVLSKDTVTSEANLVSHN